MATLKKLPPSCVAPLRLHAITLHGIGSYRTAARLEIRPLTILCGTKSTWIKVLLTLLKECVEACVKEGAKESVKDKHFPFNLYDHASHHGWQLLNAKSSLATEPWSEAEGASLVLREDVTDYGRADVGKEDGGRG